MDDPCPDSPRWPSRLPELCASLRSSESAARQAIRSEIWLVLHAALMASLRARAARVVRASREDLEDVASSKALELLASAESGVWDPTGRPAHEIAGFVARVARNGLVDLARRTGREVPSSFAENDDDWPEVRQAVAVTSEAAPEDQAHAREFGLALHDCVERLQGRARRVWFFRVFYEMSSREIAAHPDVLSNAAHVDVVAQRARDALRKCMAGHGHEAGELVPGAFARLWPTLERAWRNEPVEIGEEIQ